MKVYSDDAVTKEDLGNISVITNAAITQMDAKQTKQIRQLRTWLGVVFVANALISVGLFLAPRFM